MFPSARWGFRHPSPDKSRALADLVPALLASSEPLDKLGQSGWEESLDWTAGNPQSLSQPLKVTGVQRLV
jgi:hypothetical protein